MSTLNTHNVHVYGDPDGQPMLFAHGFGCEQGMWRFVAPAFEATHRVVLFDHMGLGGSDVAHYDPERYETLDGYADDILAICEELDLRDVIFVGHSVSAMIGVLAAKRQPERFARLVLIGPSPRYIDDASDGYVGGFKATDIDELLDTLQSNYLGWSAAMAPAIMGAPDRPELGAELVDTFCRADPDIAHRFAKATFLSDNRADLADVQTPCVVLQCSADVIAPEAVGRYVATHLPRAEFVLLDATGHCPNLSAPSETIAAIKRFL
jgi:sigma-B regulation protein RsbQ